VKQKTLRVTVEGKQYEVLVEDITAGGGERAHKAAPRAASHAAAPAAAPPPPKPAAPASSGTSGAEARIAPLAGIVTSVYVKEGAVVKKGDKVVEIEAMKQKNDVLAHRDGTVTGIMVKEGDAVDSAQLLMSIV